jgi:hypothetical protein
VAGYLALLLTLFVGVSAVSIALIAQNRIQGVADAAVLYGHDRASIKGKPDPEKLSGAVAHFLGVAPSAQQLRVHSVSTQVVGITSVVVICVEHGDPMGLFSLGKICRSAKAESFLVE